MNPIGTIRIKSIGKLLPTNNVPGENVDENMKFTPKISLTPTPLKIECIYSDSSNSLDCFDLTKDTFVTPVRKTAPKEKLKSQKKSNLKTKTTKTKVGRSQGAKPVNEGALQRKVFSFFTPSSTITKAPKKTRKPPEENGDTKLPPETAQPYQLRKSSLRRNILSSNNEPHLLEKTKSDEECAATSKRKSTTSTKSKRKSTTSKDEKSKKIKELETIIEPTVVSEVIDLCLDDDSDEDIKSSIVPPKRPLSVKSEKSICPSYKVIEGTTFAVDGFKYGRIEGVTAYFLSHYHADHYIGLTRKFAMPLYASQITANLMNEFIPVDPKYINILPINETITIEGVQVTAIDANHCPGAIMFLFQLPCGKRILHTGDFRASVEMESNPYLMQRNIDLLYLDTTYISHNYSFQTQEASIADALKAVREFKERNEGKRILFAVGTYLVGKEKFWLPIAKEFDFKIWTDSNRRKIMHAINDEEILQRLVTKDRDAEMHIIPMAKVGYKGIWAYWEDYCDAYDMIFAIRPSGWEKNSKPQYRGQINVVGIEYSEHSSHNELRRFLSFLRPKHVISTVPYGKDLTKCPDVPLSWYKEGCFSPIKKQASLLNYFKCSKVENKIS